MMSKLYPSLERNQYPEFCTRNDQLRAYFKGHFLELWLGGVRPLHFDEKDAEWFIEVCSDWLHYRKEEGQKTIDPEPGQIWRDFTGRFYHIKDIAIDVETGKDRVIICAVRVGPSSVTRADNKNWSRPLATWHDIVKDSEGNRVPRYTLEENLHNDFWQRVYEAHQKEEMQNESVD